MTIIATLQDARRPRCVDSQFPVDPRAAHGAPRREARASASLTCGEISISGLSASSVDSQFPVDPRAAHGAPRRVARASASLTCGEISISELSASSVDSQFPVDPRAAHGAPRRVARAATRNSPSIPVLRTGPLTGWLAPLPQVVEHQIVVGELVLDELGYAVHEFGEGLQ